jgi:hypothetical protein
MYYYPARDFVLHMERRAVAYHNLFSRFTNAREIEEFLLCHYYYARIYQIVGTFNCRPIPALFELFDECEFSSRVNYRSGLNPLALWRN